MQEKIHVLILEDNPQDVELMKLQLRKAGLNSTVESCLDKKTFLKTLGTFTPDILLADYSLPDFDGMEALRIARRKFPELPGVIVSGAIGEETAIEALKAGATDYVLKQRLGRLGSVINRALQEAKQVTERKRAEEELRESERRINRSQEIAHLGSWELDVANNRLTWSDEVYRIFGLEPQEFSATYEAFLERVHPDDRRSVDAVYSGSIREGRDAYEIEHRVVKKSTGEIRIVHEKCEHIRDTKGKIIRSVGMVHDITESKLAEQALKQNEAMLSLSQEAANAGSWDWDIVTNKIKWSKEYYKLCGLNPEKVKPTLKNWLKSIYPDDRSRVRQEAQEAVRRRRRRRRRENFIDIEFRINHPEKGLRWLNVKGEIFCDKTGVPLRMAGIALDITGKKAAEQEIRHLASFPRLNPNPVIELDANARVTYCSPAAINALKQLKVAKQTKLFFPPDFAEILKHLKAGKKKVFIREAQIKGAFFIETLTVIPELKVVRIYARDITGLKNTERALDDARRHLEARVAERTEDLTQANRQLIQEISERKEAERSLSIRAAILKTMGRASTRKEFLDTIVKFIKGLTRCRYIGIRVLNEEKEIPYESYIGFSREFWEKENWLCINHDQCICIRAITGKSLAQDKPFMTRGGSFHAGNAIKFIYSLSKEEKAQYRGVCVENGFASLAVVPIYYQGKIIAAIHLADERKDMLSSNTIGFMEKLTSLIGEAIHKFENEDKIRQSLMSQRAIAELIRYSFQETTVEHILNHAVESILSLEWLSLEPKASIYLADGEPGVLSLKAHKNLPEYLQKECARVTLGKCLCGKAASERKVQFSASIDKSHEIICKEMMPHGHYCVPILFGKRALGVINLYIPAGSRHDLRKEEFFITFSSTLAEIIQRRQAEDGLKKSRDRVINILESLSDGFFAGDKEWRFTYVNSAAERILEKKRSELIGRAGWDIFPKEKETKIFNELKTVMLKRVPAFFEHLSPTLNKWVEVRAYPAEEGLSVYFRDISEKKSSEEKLKEAQRQLEHAKRLSDIGTLAATVAHELRNPLAAIRMASFNIKRKAQNPLLDKHLSNIEKKISESDQIINNLLFYSRLRQPHYENVDLYKILEECLEIAKKRALKNSIKVKKKYRALRRVWVEADPLQMKELFSNILNNAYDAMHGNPGTIEISATHTNDGVVSIDIKDSGVGMDEEHLRQAHEPFFTTKAKGTGLGLTVCFQIVNLHGGNLELTSEKHKGTTVSITLPIKPSL